jgi:hypothetical protein
MTETHIKAHMHVAAARWHGYTGTVALSIGQAAALLREKANQALMRSKLAL